MAAQKKEASHNVAFAKGGKGPENRMFPAQSADPAEKGVTRDSDREDNNPHPGLTDASGHTAQGGKTKMFGFQPANPQQAGRTSSY